jgi:hypothetical protein
VPKQGLTFGLALEAADHSGATVPEIHRLPILGIAIAISGVELSHVNIPTAI